MYVHMYMFVYTDMYIPKYIKNNLLVLYSVICMYVFRADHWYWITTQCALPWERVLFLLLVFLSYCTVEAL